MTRVVRLFALSVAAVAFSACSNPTAPTLRCAPSNGSCVNVDYVNPNIDYVNPNIDYVNPNIDYVNPNI